MFRFPRLEFDADANALRAEVQEFLASELASGGFEPCADCWVSGVDPDFSRKMGQRGWLGMTWPIEYGGHARPFAHRFVVTEEMLAAGAPVAASTEKRDLVATQLPAQQDTSIQVSYSRCVAAIGSHTIW